MKVFETLGSGDKYDIRIFVDFSKAFDRVLHRRLISKVRQSSWNRWEGIRVDQSMMDGLQVGNRGYK